MKQLRCLNVEAACDLLIRPAGQDWLGHRRLRCKAANGHSSVSGWRQMENGGPKASSVALIEVMNATRAIFAGAFCLRRFPSIDGTCRCRHDWAAAVQLRNFRNV